MPGGAGQAFKSTRSQSQRPGVCRLQVHATVVLESRDLSAAQAVGFYAASRGALFIKRTTFCTCSA